MNIVSVNDSNIYLLENFVRNIGEASKSFRYYNHRSIDVIKNHLVTLLLIENNTPVAYGHLEPENNTTWLGICVLPEYYRKGCGIKMMTALIEKAKKLHLNSIYLTVDIKNENAIKLYHKFHFCRTDSNENHYKYSLQIIPAK